MLEQEYELHFASDIAVAAEKVEARILLDQHYFGRWEDIVVDTAAYMAAAEYIAAVNIVAAAVVAVAADWTISGLGDFANLGCICWRTGQNPAAAAVNLCYCKC